jgi:enoyl-CoA hydratase/carnithine racemase
VVEPDRLMQEAETYAAKIAAYPRAGVANTKAEFYGAMDVDFAAAAQRETDGELECFRSPEVKQRFREFLARRRSP